MLRWVQLVASVSSLYGMLAGCSLRPESPLAAAASRGDIPRMRALLRQSKTPDMEDSNLGGPLIAAARAGQMEALRLLLKHGADPNAKAGVNGWPVLMHAIHKNQKQAAIALMDAGADVNARGDGGDTPLMMAAGYGQTEIVRELLRRGADPRRETPDGETAFGYAVGGTTDIDRFTAGRCQASTVKTLLEFAPDLKLKDSFRDRMAQRLASWGRCKEVLAALKTSGQKTSR